MPRRDTMNFWQSFSDLAMGLMAVFILVLLIRMQSQASDQDQFQDILLDLLERASQTVERQNEVDTWIRTVFEESDCSLRYTEDGRLLLRDQDGGAAELYDSGDYVPSAAAQRAIESCRLNFQKLIFCLSRNPELNARCVSRPNDGPSSGKAPDTSKGSAAATVEEEFRASVEALVLQGNTDREPMRGAPPAKHYKFGAAEPYELGHRNGAGAFVDNAYLGAERARQAMAQLLHQMSFADADVKNQLTDAMMAHLSIESPSFGRYQAGEAWSKDCAPGGKKCDAARNLSLRLRWKKAELQRPYTELTSRLCVHLKAGADNAMSRLLGAAEIAKWRSNLRCEP